MGSGGRVWSQRVWSIRGLNLSHPSHHHHQNPRIQPFDADDRFCCSSLADFAMVDGGAYDFCLVSSKALSQNSVPAVASAPDFQKRSKELWYLTCSGLKYKLGRSVEGGGGGALLRNLKTKSIFIFTYPVHQENAWPKTHQTPVYMSGRGSVKHGCGPEGRRSPVQAA